MIVPYGHKGMKLRGLPWVTVAIFVLCVATFVLTSGPADRAAVEAEEIFSQIAEIYLVQPSLEIAPEFEDLLFQRLGVDENQREVFLESLRKQSVNASRTGSRSSQRELDALTNRYWSVYRGSPQYRFGVVPQAIEPFDLVTYQFLHGGWLHLLGNLLFLYIAGPHLEQRWGRPLYLGFYLAAGIVAALFWALRYPELDVPLVGASGSIAGLMGAFLICYWNSKIKFFYWFFVVWGTFEAPAWLMGPLWLIIEVISGRTMDVLSQGDGGGGVAHWAHVWGFIFGMVFAWGMSLLGVDGRLAARTASGVAIEPEDVGSAGEPVDRPRRERPVGEGKAQTLQDSDVRPAHDEELERRVEEMPVPGASNLATSTEASDTEAEPLEMIEIAEDTAVRVEIRPAERLRVLEACPRELDAGRLTFEVPEGPRQLDLAKVEGVAVGAIAQPGVRPFLIIDLLLDSPSDGTGDLRVVRLRSSAFDPRTLVGGEQAMSAFIQLIHRLQSASSGLVLPDEVTSRNPSAHMYESIEEYQGEVLGVMG